MMAATRSIGRAPSLSLICSCLELENLGRNSKPRLELVKLDMATKVIHIGIEDMA